MSQQLKKAISAVNKHGALLIFPIQNSRQPLSLWHVLYPRSQMRWEWDDSGDDRVVKLWHLREELSRSGQVIYTKWYKGRATVFSRSVFTKLLSVLESSVRPRIWGAHAQDILQVLEDNSPLSTKELKRAVDLKGRDLESTYNRAMKVLWQQGLIVGWGEVEEGAFPSLAIGATKLLFEEIWKESQELDSMESELELMAELGKQNLFLHHLQKIKSKLNTDELEARLLKRKGRAFDFE